MRILIAGGRGFLGSALSDALRTSGHQVRTLTRRDKTGPDEVHWDGETLGAWTAVLNETDAVVNACGYGLEHWPWTARRKQRFIDSRVVPGRLLAEAIVAATKPPSVLVQFSGINRYGLHGTTIADESSLPAGDFLAQLTVAWEASSEIVEALRVRRVVIRNAVVLDTRDGLFPLMSLPCRIFMGGRLGSGQQFVPWIHVQDHAQAVRYLLENEDARGAYNLVAPMPTSNAEFMRAICTALRRPYWFHVPAKLLDLLLGEMAVLVLAGRASQPRRLLEAGYKFAFPSLELAVRSLFDSHNPSGGSVMSEN